MNSKWNQERRKLLYTELKMHFGPAHKWPKRKPDGLDEILERMAKHFTEECGKNITPRAIDQQLQWALTKEKQVGHSSHTTCLMFNKVAAKEVGFIDNSYFPSYMLMEMRNKKSIKD